MGRCTSLVGLKGVRRASRCNTVRDMLWVSGDGGGGGVGRLVNEVERVGEGGGV